MLRRSTCLLFGLLCLALVPLATLRSAGQDRVTTPQEISDREVKLEYELRRLREMVAGMGENHPHLKLTQKKISELQAELVAISRGAGPFAEALVAEREDIDTLLRQMSEQEVRQAVLHLFGQIKDLQRRLDKIESARR